LFVLCSLFPAKPSFAIQIQIEPNLRIESLSLMPENREGCHNLPIKRTVNLKVTGPSTVEVSTPHPFIYFDQYGCDFRMVLSVKDVTQNTTYPNVSISTPIKTFQSFLARFHLAVDPVVIETDEAEFKEQVLLDRGSRLFFKVIERNMTPQSLIQCTFKKSQSGATQFRWALKQTEFQSLNVNQATQLLGRYLKNSFELALEENSNQVIWIRQTGPTVEFWQPGDTLVSCAPFPVPDTVFDLSIPEDVARYNQFLK